MIWARFIPFLKGASLVTAVISTLSFCTWLFNKLESFGEMQAYVKVIEAQNANLHAQISELGTAIASRARDTETLSKKFDALRAASKEITHACDTAPLDPGFVDQLRLGAKTASTGNRKTDKSP